MRVQVVALLAVAALAAARPAWHELDGYTHADYLRDFDKQYKCEKEAAMRKDIFEKRLEQIRRHNLANKSWKEGVNHMSDWTEDEFKSMLGYDKHVGHMLFARQPQQLLGMARLQTQDHVDWREKGVVSDVKDQGMCGSCWTFAATETIESHHALKTGVLEVLSEQNILDCVANPQECGGTGGCQGGTAELAYTYLKDTGIASEWTYPYTSYFGENFNCSARAPRKTKITGYVRLPSNKYAPLMNAVTTQGPIAISVEAMHWMNYETGVFDGCNQTNPDIDHAVQLVGYGTDSSAGDYWLVRNSWSPNWGEKGYIRIARTKDEDTRCGTDIAPGDGFGCKGGPATIPVCGTCGILSDSCYPTV